MVHNLKDIDDENVVKHVWATQVTQIYGQGLEKITRVAAINPQTSKLEEKNVTWFKTEFTRHICLANADSPVGTEINPWSLSLLKY